MPVRPFARYASDDVGEDVVAVDLPGSMTSPERKLSRKQSLLNSLKSRWRKPQGLETLPAPEVEEQKEQAPAGLLERRVSNPELGPKRRRRAVPSLPRPQTFLRRESERRERLLELPESRWQRNGGSVDRRRGWSVGGWGRERGIGAGNLPEGNVLQNTIVLEKKDGLQQDRIARPSEDPLDTGLPDRDGDMREWDDEFAGSVWDRNFDEASEDGEEKEIDPAKLQAEFNSRWILNLSMSFRDKSLREKFFITYAEAPNRWRRLTISLDYRTAPPGSLESDLMSLHYQRDKSFRVFEALHESLVDIQYYDTVTNLKLETTTDDNQLHVHVREDANEIIHYPSADLFAHVECPHFPESSVELSSHLSGFVYKVRVDGSNMPLIKKEIPGPDTVDEFLYEVNAIASLADAPHVIQLRGLIVSDDGELVKGLLINYASGGALVDTIYDHAGTLSWDRRAKWAGQIVEGLSAIHEAGFVQGDFTLSNIVLDENDDAMIIDINRRGCPVGWEPPELAKLIESGQRIAMCIGVKTDLFQLGMVLWALAEEVEEPERQRPLSRLDDRIPTYYRWAVDKCLSEKPQGRLSAVALLREFPPAGYSSTDRSAVEFSHSPIRATVAVGWRDDDAGHALHGSNPSVSTHRSDKEYIDPSLAVTLAEVHRHQHQQQSHRHQRPNSELDCSPPRSFTNEEVTYFNPVEGSPNTSYQYDSSGSWIVGRSRGRSPGSSRRRRSSPFTKRTGTATEGWTEGGTSATSLSSASPERISRRSVGKTYRCYDDESERELEVESEPDAARQSEIVRMASPESLAGLTRMASPQAMAVDKRLAHVQYLAREASWGSGYETARIPLHQDSGFDEAMLEDLGIHESAAVGVADPRDDADTPRPGDANELAPPA